MAGSLAPPPKSIDDVLNRAQQALARAQLGLKDLLEDADVLRQINGISTVAIQGRAVTNILEHIRTFDRDGFDAWWAPRVKQMQTDPLLRFFYTLRTITLKEGAPKVHVTNSLDPQPRALERLASTGILPGATDHYSTYFKSSYMESGNVFKSQKTYIPLPKTQQTERQLILGNPPYEHLGEKIMDLTAQGLCILYVEYLGNLVRDAKTHFSPSETSSA